MRRGDTTHPHRIQRDAPRASRKQAPRQTRERGGRPALLVLFALLQPLSQCGWVDGTTLTPTSVCIKSATQVVEVVVGRSDLVTLSLYLR